MTFEQSFPEIYKMQIIKLSEEAHCEHLHNRDSESFETISAHIDFWEDIVVTA